jgi:hypothetical protein
MRNILRAKDLRDIDGLSPSARERERAAGRYPKPFPLSTDPRSRAIGWFADEIVARRDAIAAGATDDELKKLVSNMETTRKTQTATA